MDPEKEHVHALQATAAALSEGKMPTTEQAVDALEALKQSEELEKIQPTLSHTGQEVISSLNSHGNRFQKMPSICWKMPSNC
jgi:hypothetical protein